MRKGILFLFGMLLLTSNIQASEGKNISTVVGVENRYDDAVTFIERGIKFHIFLNGDFDFNTRRLRNSINRRVRVYRDYRGRINRIENVFINYDYQGNVRKIGSVFMSYRRGRLTRVGNLRVNYNRWGDPRFYGQVRYNNYYNDYYYNNNYNAGVNLSIGAICTYNDPYFYGREFRNNYTQFRVDNNFYYYRARPNARVSKSKVLKRKRPAKVQGKVVKKRTNKKNERRRRS